MEPTINKNKTKTAIIVIIIIVLIIGIFFLIKSKSVKSPTIDETKIETPGKVVTKTVITDSESKEITEYLDNATTFDNEPLLAEIDKEF